MLPSPVIWVSLTECWSIPPGPWLVPTRSRAHWCPGLCRWHTACMPTQDSTGLRCGSPQPSGLPRLELDSGTWLRRQGRHLGARTPRAPGGFDQGLLKPNKPQGSVTMCHRCMPLSRSPRWPQTHDRNTWSQAPTCSTTQPLSNHIAFPSRVAHLHLNTTTALAVPPCFLSASVLMPTGPPSILPERTKTLRPPSVGASV